MFLHPHYKELIASVCLSFKGLYLYNYSSKQNIGQTVLAC